MSNLETVLADAGYEQINADLIEQLKKKQEAGTLTAAEANLLAEIEALGLDLSTLDGQALTAEDLQALGDAQVSLPSPASAPFASGGLGGLAGLGALGGGGGGGASGGTAVASIGGSLQGQLINGYIQGARVFQDANGDGILNNGEIYADTDSEGGFTLSGYIAGGGDIIASTTSATTDVTTGATVTTDFKLALSASTDTSNGVVISPLSTLLADGGISESDLKSKLGIDAGIDIITYDPIATALSGSASEVANALKFKSVSTQVSNLLDVGASALSANSDHSKDSATEGVVASLIDKLNAGTNSNIDLTGTTFLTETLDLAASKLSITDTTDLDAVKGNTISNLGSLNQKIEDAEANTADPTAALSSMYTAARVAQVDLETAIETASSDGGSDADLTGFDVDSQIASADIPAVNLVSNSKFDSATGWSGNAANAVDGANYANPTAAGNPWDVNLSYVLSLTQGESYTLSFRAKGAEGRALKAGLGLNVAPYTNDVSDITLTADWETYTVNVESIAFGGDDSRVIFDMGHDVGEVFIDDVVLNLVESETSESSEEPSDSSAVFDGLAFSADSTVEAFEGSSAEAIADTTDGAEAGNYVIQYTKTPTSKNYAGVTVGDLTGNLVDSIPFDIDGGTTAISARIYTAEAGKVVRMQVADSSGSNDANYVHAAVTLDSVGWNTVTFDFASPVARWVNANGAESTVALNANVTYDEISIFPDWENGLDYNGNAVGTALTADAVYYIDDVQMASSTDDTLEGQLINGYIQGAMVFQDINGDGEHNEGEAFDYTDSEGAFTLEGYVAGSGEVIASTNANTTDVTTGAKVTTEFKLNLDADTDVSEGVVISPLSTLLVSGELDEAGLKAKLGIDESIDIFSYDPIAAAEAAGNLGDTAAAEIALQFKSASTQVSNFLDVGASTIGKSTGLEKDQAMFGVIDSLIQKFATDDPIDFADTSFLSSAIDIAAQSLVTEMPDFEFDFTSLDQVKSTTVTKLGDLNQKIEDAIANTSDVGAALSEMYKSAKVAQDDLEAKIEEIFAAETIDATLLQSFGSFDLDAALGEVDLDAEIPEFNLIGNATFDGDWGWTDATVVDGAYFRNVAEPGQAHEANLSYALPLMQGETYTLTFRAKGTEGRSLIAGVGLNQAPWTADTEEVTLTADWETHSITVSSADFDSFNGRVLFDMGHEAGEVYIDDVVLNFAETSSSSSSGSPADLNGYTLAFEDNFDDIGAGPNGQNWVFDEGNDGWGNNEVQDYQSDLDDAMIVDGGAGNGALQITAQGVNGNITSARVRSDIDNLDPYGYFEVRAKLPSEAGAWPAIWLLGDGGRQTWPNEGEIDLVEWSSAYHDEATGTDMISALHYPDNHGGNANDVTHSLDTPVDEWHVYQTWWTPTEIAIGVDGTREDAHLVYTKPDGADNDAWPFDGPMDLIMNIAIGGTLGGSAPTGDFSYNMLIDYVRVYQNPDHVSTGSGTGSTAPTSAADAPTEQAADVISLFSDSYTDITVNNFGPVWGNWQTSRVTNADGMLQVSNLNVQGIQIADPSDNSGSVDASAKESLNVDVWLPEAGSFKWFLISPGPAEASVTLTGDAGWNSFNIDLDAFSGVDLANIIQFKLDAQNLDDAATDFYLDNIYFNDSASDTGVPTAPTSAADAPTEQAADVISLFSDSYTDITVNNFGPVWGNWQTSRVTNADGMLQVSNLNVQGIQIADPSDNSGSVDASAKESLNVDVWLPEAGSFKWFLISPGPAEASVTLTGDAGWNSFNIDLDAFSGVDLANIIQFKLDAQNLDDAATDFYLDNIYFNDSTADTAVQSNALEPTSAAPTPTDLESSVISLFSDSYNDLPGTTWSTTWDGVDVSDQSLGSNTFKKYVGNGFIGIEPGSTIDANGMNTFNVSVFRTDATADLKIKLVDFGAGGAYGGGDDVEHEITFAAGSSDAVPAGEWVNLRIDLDDFTGLTTKENIAQIIVSSHETGTTTASNETLYIDNMYFSDNLVVNSTFDDATGWSGVAANAVDGANYANVAQAGNAWDVNLSYVLSLTAGESYTLTFRAKGEDGRALKAGIGLNEGNYASATNDFTLTTDWETYTVQVNNVSFGSANSRVLFDMGHDTGEVFIDDVSLVRIAGPSEAAPAPTDLESSVISLFSDSYTDQSGTTWSTTWDGVNVSDVQVGSNTVKKYVGTGNTPGTIGIETAATDISGMNTFNVSVFRTDATADLKIKLVDFGAGGAYGGGDDVEHEITFAAGSSEAVPAGEWVNLRIDLDDFTGLTTKENISQIIISSHVAGSDPIANSNETLYIDNMYFSDNLVVNSTFDDATGWSGVAANAVDGANYANVAQAGNAWDVNLSYVLSLTAGESYTLTFRAKGEDGRALKAGIGLNEGNYASATNDFTLTTDWETYTVQVNNVSFGSANSRVLFDMGHDTGEVFIDDVSLVRIAGPSEAAPAPTDLESSVISLFSDSYTDQSGTTWSTTWDGVNVSDVQVGSNTVKKYVGTGNTPGTIGIETAATDISGMNTFNVSVFRTDATADLKIKLVDFGAGGAYGGGDDVEHEITFAAGSSEAVPAGEWVNLRIDLDDFTGLTTKENISQIIISSHVAGSDPIANSNETLYIDNMYFSKALVLDFEPEDSPVYDLTDMTGVSSSVLSDNQAPAGSYGRAVQVTKSGASTAGTTFVDFEGDGRELISDGSETVSIRILSAKDGATIRLKLEDSTDSTASIEVDATTASDGTNAWETLTWDFSSADHTETFDKATIIFDAGTAGAGEEYYFDDVTFNGFIS